MEGGREREGGREGGRGRECDKEKARRSRAQPLAHHIPLLLRSPGSSDGCLCPSYGAIERPMVKSGSGFCLIHCVTDSL